MKVATKAAKKTAKKTAKKAVTLPRRWPACFDVISIDPATADAGFSPCGRYRWWLRRQWQPQRPGVVFIGLNPSRADGMRDDPTLRRIVGFARSWGYGSVLVLNLFARISPSPAALRRCGDPLGPDNEHWLRVALDPAGAAAVWLGWGNLGAWRGRDRQVLAMLQGAAPELPLLALGLTAQGQPRHPLYAPAATRPLLLTPRLTPLLPTPPLAQTRGTGAFCAQRAAPPWPALPGAMPSTCT